MEELKSRNFKIWAYTVSHSTLINRSEMKYEDQEGYDENTNYNIDLEFSATAYLDIPNIMNGVSIEEQRENIPDKYWEYVKLGFKVYVLKSDSNIYHIVAGNCTVGKNKWISEDRIKDSDLQYEEVLASI